MKYALVLISDLKRKDWICYQLADSDTEIENSNCFNPTVIKLPKSNYPGTPVSQLKKVSCETGNTSSFAIVQISNINLSGKFNLA